MPRKERTMSGDSPQSDDLREISARFEVFERLLTRIADAEDERYTLDREAFELLQQLSGARGEPGALYRIEQLEGAQGRLVITVYGDPADDEKTGLRADVRTLKEAEAKRKRLRYAVDAAILLGIVGLIVERALGG